MYQMKEMCLRKCITEKTTRLLTFSHFLNHHIPSQTENIEDLNYSACSAITQEALVPTLSHASHFAKHPSHLGPIH